MAMASTLDQVGIFTHDARDAALILSVIAGYDQHDATSSKESVPDYAGMIDERPKVRLGVPKEFREGLSGEALAWFETELKRISSLDGVKLVDISLPHIRESLAVYYIIMPAEVSANMARYDGLRYGAHTTGETLEELYRSNRSQGFGAEVRRRILLGTFVLSAGYHDAYYTKAAKVRSLITHECLRAFDTVDAIIGPTSPTPAFKLGEKQSDPLAMYLSDIYTVAANIAGVPAVSFPSGTIDGLPMGMQLMGPYWSEARLVSLVDRLSRAS
jgi:aspartyl-tRNA(Asn)/glutamyl-tRNA(Gln) amidotransferase subunit A